MYNETLWVSDIHQMKYKFDLWSNFSKTLSAQQYKRKLLNVWGFSSFLEKLAAHGLDGWTVPWVKTGWWPGPGAAGDQSYILLVAGHRSWLPGLFPAGRIHRGIWAGWINGWGQLYEIQQGQVLDLALQALLQAWE